MRPTPEHWTWSEEPVAPRAEAVVVDIDGVLSDATARQHYVEAPRSDWRAFFAACGDDPVIDEVRTLLDLLAPGLRIVLLTARPSHIHHLTRAWLSRYSIRWDLLLMRPYGDYEASRDFKQSAVWDLRAYGFVLRLAFEDDLRNVEMFRDEGIPCMYVHSGYYD